MAAKVDKKLYEVKGLNESIAAMRSITGKLTPASNKAIRRGMSQIVGRARGSARSRTGGGTYPRDVAGHYTARLNTITLSRGSGSTGYGFAAEFGSDYSMVFGRPDSGAKPPHFAPHLSGGFGFAIRGRVPGYHLGPAITALEKPITIELNEDLNRMMQLEFRRKGIDSKRLA